MAKEYITVKQAAAMLGVTDARVRQILATGILSAAHFAGVWRIAKVDVEWLKKERAEGKK